MGLERLSLVAPKMFPHSEATARASGADNLLHTARVFDELESAVADCGLVLGASARLRSLPWPTVDPREAAAKIAALPETTQAAVVFGREKSGLSNDELAQCHALVHIPANPEYSSLNLAMAVQVLAYEIARAKGLNPTHNQAADSPPAAAQDVERFFAHLEQVLLETGFLDPNNPRHLMRRLRRLFNRAELDQNEVNILRGILASVEQYHDQPAAGSDTT